MQFSLATASRCKIYVRERWSCLGHVLKALRIEEAEIAIQEARTLVSCWFTSCCWKELAGYGSATGQWVHGGAQGSPAKT